MLRSLSDGSASSLSCRRQTSRPLCPALLHAEQRVAYVEESAVGEGEQGASGRPPAAARLSDVCEGRLPTWLLERAEQSGFVSATRTQEVALPVVLSGEDCVIYAQTGSGKTLAYALPLVAAVDGSRAAVQAIVLVPTRELGVQVVRVLRQLAKKGGEEEPLGGGRQDKGSITVMALLDGGTSSRQKSWLKAEPPQVVVGTPDRVSRMIETGNLRPGSVRCLVVDEVDAVLDASKLSGSRSLQKILSACAPPAARQTIFASATVPQHHRFLQDCIHNKWTKGAVKFLHVEPDEKVPPTIRHRFVVCRPDGKEEALRELIATDEPRAAVVFASDLTEKGRKAAELSPVETVAEYLSGGSAGSGTKVATLQDDIHIRQRATTVQDFRAGNYKVLVATEIAARGLDLPEVSHVYNFSLPQDARAYIHRAGRTGRKPLIGEVGIVTTLVTAKELFVLKRLENELRVHMQEVFLST